MDKLEKLLNDYTEAHPDAENPLNFYNLLGEEGLIEALEKANGKELVWSADFNSNTLDGGQIEYR